jgi:metal-responsive CopG/Arc/MetJ family transcriptional regulator
MKTAISIPDTVYQQAEQAARQMKMTRSELYTKAVASFLERHHAQDITEKLNEVYAQDSSALAPEFAAAQAALLAAEEW